MHVAAVQNADEMQNLQCFSNCRFSGSVVKVLTVLSFLSAGPFAHSLLQTDSLMSVDLEWIFGCDHALHLTHSHRSSWSQANCPLPLPLCLWVQKCTCITLVVTFTAFPRPGDVTLLLVGMVLLQSWCCSVVYCFYKWWWQTPDLPHPFLSFSGAWIRNWVWPFPEMVVIPNEILLSTGWITGLRCCVLST